MTTLTTTTRAAAPPPMTTTSAKTQTVATATSFRKQSRMNVDLTDSNATLFQRVFIIREEGGAFWPCIYFSSYAFMLEELMNNDTLGEIANDAEINEIALSWCLLSDEQLDEDDEPEDVPLVLLLAKNTLILNPNEADMTTFANGAKHIKNSKHPLMKNAKLRITCASKISKAGVKRPFSQLEDATPAATKEASEESSTPVAASTAGQVAMTKIMPGAAVSATTVVADSPSADKKKKAAAVSNAAKVSPGGDSVQDGSRTNKRTKLSRSAVDEAEYSDKDGNLKLDDVEANWEVKSAATTEDQRMAKATMEDKPTKATVDATMEDSSKLPKAPKASKGNLVQDLHVAVSNNLPKQPKASKGSLVQDVHVAAPHPKNTRPIRKVPGPVPSPVEETAVASKEAAAAKEVTTTMPVKVTKQATKKETATTTAAEDMDMEPIKEVTKEKVVRAKRQPRGATSILETTAPTTDKRKARQANFKSPKPKAKAKVFNTKATPKKIKKRIRKTPKKIAKISLTPMPTNSKQIPVILTKEEREIPEWLDVRDLFFGLGFTDRAYSHQSEAEFCFPSGDPQKAGDNSIEGKNYFTSMDAFQARLCAHGFGEITEVSDMLDTSTPVGAKVERWIRLSPFATQLSAYIKAKAPLPKDRYKKVNFKEIKKYGFSWLRGEYSFPGAELGSPWNPDGIPISFVDEDDFFTHLSRFGYPKECNLGVLEADELKQFVLPLIFHKRDLLDPSPHKGRGNRRRRFTGKAAEVAESTKKAKKPLSIKKPKASATKTVDIVVPQSSSPSNFDKIALEDVNKNPPLQGGRDLRGRNISPDLEKAKDVNKLKLCLDKLESTRASDSTWLGEKGNHFRKNAFAVRTFLGEMVRNRGPSALENIEDDNGRNSLYICGTPGIGKTTAVNWCTQHLIEQYEDDNIDLVVVNLNCSQFASGGDNVRKSFFKKVWAGCNSGKRSNGDAEGFLTRSLKSTNAGKAKKKFLILVLDEIDQLVDPTSELKNAKGSGEVLLQHLSGWTVAGEKMRFALVGIGNAMNNVKYRRADKFVQFSKSYSFQAYNEKDMEEIMRSRLENSDIVLPAALTFIAKKYAGSSGDVRKAIEHLGRALKGARARAKDDATVGSQLLAGPKQGPFLVGIRDVVKINADYAKLSQTIEDLPRNVKIAVAVAAKMLQKNGEGSISRKELVHKFIMFYTNKFKEGIDAGEARSGIDSLDDQGIANFNYSDGNATISFNYLALELQEAARVALGKDGFFDL